MKHCWLVCLMFLIGCMPVRSARSLPGTYRFSAEYATALLTLKADGTYMEEYNLHGGPLQHCQGHWSWQSEDGDLELIGGVVLPPYVQSGMNSSMCVEAADIAVMRDIHGVYIEVDPDGPDQFYKIRP